MTPRSRASTRSVAVRPTTPTILTWGGPRASSTSGMQGLQRDPGRSHTAHASTAALPCELGGVDLERLSHAACGSRPLRPPSHVGLQPLFHRGEYVRGEMGGVSQRRWRLSGLQATTSRLVATPRSWCSRPSYTSVGTMSTACIAPPCASSTNLPPASASRCSRPTRPSSRYAPAMQWVGPL
jgi:hypothetical protein